jgi:Flp pilus assembly protein TadG
MKRQLFGRGGDNSGAVAATVGLSLFALVAAGGLAFDYARLATLDTEMQNAADQAALAAATQLDQQAGAIARATAAANGLLANQTLMANDNNAANFAINTTSVVFYATKADAEAANGTNCPTTNAISPTATGADAAAKFVCVRTMDRVARYALTPIAEAFSSGNISAMAVAGLGSAICKTPPVMMCNPAEATGNTNIDLDFPANALRGAGVVLIAGDADAPGNFGFLDTGIGQGNSTPELAQNLGYNVPPGECQPTSGVDLKTGARDVVLNALNTRFDIDTSGENTCPGAGPCNASRNSRKDLVKGNNCGIGGQQGWDEAPVTYYGKDPTAIAAGLPVDASNDPSIMGHPRDICHARATEAAPGTFCTSTNGGFNGRIGDKGWDRDAYFRVNFGWNNATWRSNTGLSATATRYEVYLWELANPATADRVQDMGTNPNKAGYSYPVCRTPGVTPSAAVPDRRRLSIAVINCEARNLNGAETDVPVIKWVDVFLVEPAFVRKRGNTAVTGGRDVYVEIIGETVAGGAGSTAGQVVRRDVPYLIK